KGALATVEHKAVEKDVGLQRVVHRGKLPRKSEQPVEVSAQLHGITPPVLIITGVKLGNVRLHEAAVIEHVGLQFEQIVELGNSHLSVDAPGPEFLRMLGKQIVGQKP